MIGDTGLHFVLHSTLQNTTTSISGSNSGECWAVPKGLPKNPAAAVLPSP